VTIFSTVKEVCLSFGKHNDMKMYDRVEIELHGYLTTGLDGSEW
jgi:hypothetical protein